ncbi:hypothetical protein HaLaN_14716 [Haematococcus lacustris]|uniref:Retrotransposon gag domain-containing protein n=1 Tax=Haematococcus lacustris TaxID=44745 RepID=A0A699Z8S1_HAELA|nr:hypothetical protein HaLaN_14716 [Haematococcus lacustris]
MPVPQWVPYAAGLLTGGAEVWWSQQVVYNTPAATCWEAFVGELCEHYTHHEERAWQPAAHTSATLQPPQRCHTAAPTALLTTSNRFATLRVADEQQQQLPSQPAKLDEHQAAAAAIAAAAVAAVLRAAVEAEGQEQQGRARAAGAGVAGSGARNTPLPVWKLRSLQQQQQQQPQPLSISPQA